MTDVKAGEDESVSQRLGGLLNINWLLIFLCSDFLAYFATYCGVK